MKLSEYLEHRGISARKFAEKAKISPPTIRNAIKGKDIWLSTALKIEKASEGKVKCKDLIDEDLWE